MMTAALLAGAMLGETPSGLGRVPLEPPTYGTWPTPGRYPPTVSVTDVAGVTRTFARARYRLPLSGVVQQYREAVPTFSQHMCVYVDGSFAVLHTDEVNPDGGPGAPGGAGTLLAHAAKDAPELTTKTCALLGFTVGLVGGLYYLRT